MKIDYCDEKKIGKKICQNKMYDKYVSLGESFDERLYINSAHPRK